MTVARNALCAFLCLLLLPVQACEAPLFAPHPESVPEPMGGPSFVVQPQESAADTACDDGVAFLMNPVHLTSLQVDFFPPGSGTKRTKCGALPFDEPSTDTGTVQFRQSIVSGIVGHWETWGRRLRNASNGTAPKSFFGLRQVMSAYTTSYADTFNLKAPAHDAYDLVFFAYRHGPSQASVLDTLTETNGAAQLWRQIAVPSDFAVERIDAGHALVRWTNQHLGRPIDSTQLWKNTGSGWQNDTSVAYNVNQVVRPATSGGTHRWIARHVTARLLFYQEDVFLPVPNSGFTPEGSIVLGPPPPLGPVCEGNFDPTLDCGWYNPFQGAETEVWRGSTLKATVAPGVTTWTDSSVTRGVPYTYRLRHVLSDVPGNFGPPDTAVANPLPPEGLNCAGTDSTTITCLWGPAEPNDSTAVERRVGTGDWTQVAMVLPGLDLVDDGLSTKFTYCYRARYRRGVEYSAYSSEDCAVPGDGGPLRPDP